MAPTNDDPAVTPVTNTAPRAPIDAASLHPHAGTSDQVDDSDRRRQEIEQKMDAHSREVADILQRIRTHDQEVTALDEALGQAIEQHAGHADAAQINQQLSQMRRVGEGFSAALLGLKEERRAIQAELRELLEKEEGGG